MIIILMNNYNRLCTISRNNSQILTDHFDDNKHNFLYRRSRPISIQENNKHRIGLDLLLSCIIRTKKVENTSTLYHPDCGLMRFTVLVKRNYTQEQHGRKNIHNAPCAWLLKDVGPEGELKHMPCLISMFCSVIRLR